MTEFVISLKIMRKNFEELYYKFKTFQTFINTNNMCFNINGSMQIFLFPKI